MLRNFQFEQVNQGFNINLQKGQLLVISCDVPKINMLMKIKLSITDKQRTQKKSKQVKQ